METMISSALIKGLLEGSLLPFPSNQGLGGRVRV